jgi:23S rRNA pseudouridine1911/1915/1917 synthase
MWYDTHCLANPIPEIPTERGNINLRVNQKSSINIIDSSSSGQRLDKFLNQKYPSVTRSHLQNLISKGDVTVNTSTVKSGYQLKLNDEVNVVIPENQPSHIEPEDIPLDVLFEDKSVMVINKSAGMIVHPGAGHYNGTLVNALLYHCKNLSGINGVLRPGIVHRLDKNTSGLLVVAKNDQSHVYLSRQFEEKSISRIYHTFVWGVPKAGGEIITQIGRNRRDRKKMTVLKSGGREAITEYQILKDYLYLSYLEISLKTGRTHQIRVHLNYINHPVFGDPEYNGRKSQIYRLPSHLQKRGASLLKSIDRQALHAKQLQFIHPKTNKMMRFDSKLPEDMQFLVDKIDDTLMIREEV